MTSSSRLFVVLALSAVAMSPARAVRAQARAPTAQELETARTLYKEGKELRAQGDLRGALDKLQAAHALGNTPVTGIELARTYLLLHQLIEAREVAISIAHIPVAGDETEKSAGARLEAAKLADELRPRIPTLAVTIEGLAAGEAAHLAIDGVGVPDVAIGEPQKVDPGRHELVLRAGDGASKREVRASADATEGQTVTVVLHVPPAPAPALAPAPAPARAPAPEPSPPRHEMPLLVKLGFGAAVAGGAVGVFSGLTAISKKNALSSECNAQKQCDAAQGGTGDLQAAYGWATASTVGFVLGGAGLAVGVVGLLTDHAPSAPASGARIAPWIGAGTAGVHGSF